MTTQFLGDTAALTGRSLRHITRSPDTIITTTIMPIAFLLLFVYVFGGAINTGSESYVNYLLPGILVITIASGISYTAYRLFLDKQNGIFERFRSMPIARSSLLWAPGLTAKTVDGASAFSYPLIFLPFVSSAFVPTAGMPGPVRAFAEHQPVTSIVDTLRHLLAGQPVGGGVWTALTWCAGLLVVACAGATSVYRRTAS